MNAKLDEYIDAVKHLPPSPSIMVELIKLLERPDRNIDQLVDLMSHDPSLTAEILRRCNSAYFGNDEPATDIFEATFRLGFYEVYQVATALFGSRALRFSGAERGLDLDAVWQHSALTAVAAGFVAKELQHHEAIAFTAGLLHDVGKVVLACAEGATYALLAQSAHARKSLCLAESEFFGFHHGEIGARLLERWGLTESIVRPVQFHHDPEKSVSNEDLAAILHLSDYIAHCLVPGPNDSPPTIESDDFSLRCLKLEFDRLPELIGRVQADSTRVQQLFQVGKS